MDSATRLPGLEHRRGRPSSNVGLRNLAAAPLFRRAAQVALSISSLPHGEV
jgi:hypothetical protein